MQAFEVLTSRTAYVLGLIVADGSIYGDRVKVTNNRIDVLKEVRSALKSNHPIGVPRALRDKSFTVTISNRQLAKDLRSWGIVENKSLKGAWPEGIPDALFGDVLRGYFDGDGYADHTRRRGLRLKFTSGSPDLLRGISTQLHERFGVPIRPISHDKGRPNANRLWYNGSFAARVGEIMYASGGFCIEYKRQPFIDFARRMVS